MSKGGRKSKPKRLYVRDRKGRFHRCPGSALNRRPLGHCRKCGYEWNDGWEFIVINL